MLVEQTEVIRVLDVRFCGVMNYLDALNEMRDWTHARSQVSSDRVWFVQHDPVFTLGQAGKREHLLDPGTIPVVQSDRGGQVTYHGPGQMVAYVMMDLKRRGLRVRDLVTGLEQCVIDLLSTHGLAAERIVGAPGVYVSGRKIAALGLRVRQGRSYHGLSLNVDMDLAPFRAINPCGYAGLEITQLRDLGVDCPLDDVYGHWLQCFTRTFAYTAVNTSTGDGRC